MSEKQKKKVVIIGCGAVAWHLAYKFKRDDLFIYNHKSNPELTRFKTEFNAHTFNNFKNIIPDANHYFVCVKDEHISEVLNKISYLPPSSSIGISSGNFNLKDYKGKLKNFGIIYPLQTFSKDDEIKWKDITIVADALNKTTLSNTILTAQLLSEDVITLNYEQRLNLHIAAVFANNFSNSLYVEAEHILKSIDPKFSITLLYPLLKQSIKKLKYISPLEAQTGPAKRNDKEVMEKHEAALKNNTQLKEVYKIMSNLIVSQQKTKK
jgi:predicted short-subunit dehydrogenase-like oxidoreductase (DUF2520 family)